MKKNINAASANNVKKPIYKRVWFWGAIVLAIVAISTTTQNTDGHKAKAHDAATQVKATAKKNAQAEFDATKTYKAKDVTLKIDSTEKTTDYDGNPALDINFTVTNTGKTTDTVEVMFLEAAKVIQDNGTTSNDLQVAMKLDGEETHLLDQLNPGSTISGTYSVELEDETTPVTIQFHPGLLFKSDAQYQINQ